jgi:hypothetical protein
MLESDWPLADGYRIVALADQSDVGPDDVLALWEREASVPAEEGRRRVHETLLVGLHEEGELAGVVTAYIQRNDQLGMDLWYFRAFVADAHRMSGLAVNFLFAVRDHLRERFASGRDTRAGGILGEVENEGLKTHFDEAVWLPSDFTFIGENERGDHVRVHYFPGARAPDPPA